MEHWMFSVPRERALRDDDTVFVQHLRGLHELMTQEQAKDATAKLVALAAESKAGELRDCNRGLTGPERQHLIQVDHEICNLCQNLGLTYVWGDPRGYMLHITNIPGNQAFTRAYGLR